MRNNVEEDSEPSYKPFSLSLNKWNIKLLKIEMGLWKKFHAEIPTMEL